MPATRELRDLRAVDVEAQGRAVVGGGEVRPRAPAASGACRSSVRVGAADVDLRRPAGSLFGVGVQAVDEVAGLLLDDRRPPAAERRRPHPGLERHAGRQVERGRVGHGDPVVRRRRTRARRRTSRRRPTRAVRDRAGIAVAGRVGGGRAACPRRSRRRRRARAAARSYGRPMRRVGRRAVLPAASRATAVVGACEPLRVADVSQSAADTVRGVLGAEVRAVELELDARDARRCRAAFAVRRRPVGDRRARRRRRSRPSAASCRPSRWRSPRSRRADVAGGVLGGDLVVVGARRRARCRCSSSRSAGRSGSPRSG